MNGQNHQPTESKYLQAATELGNKLETEEARQDFFMLTDWGLKCATTGYAHWHPTLNPKDIPAALVEQDPDSKKLLDEILAFAKAYAGNSIRYVELHRQRDDLIGMVEINAQMAAGLEDQRNNMYEQKRGLSVVVKVISDELIKIREAIIATGLSKDNPAYQNFEQLFVKYQGASTEFTLQKHELESLSYHETKTKRKQEGNKP